MCTQGFECAADAAAAAAATTNLTQTGLHFGLHQVGQCEAPLLFCERQMYLCTAATATAAMCYIVKTAVCVGSATAAGVPLHLQCCLCLSSSHEVSKCTFHCCGTSNDNHQAGKQQNCLPQYHMSCCQLLHDLAGLPSGRCTHCWAVQGGCKGTAMCLYDWAAAAEPCCWTVHSLLITRESDQ